MSVPHPVPDALAARTADRRRIAEASAFDPCESARVFACAAAEVAS